MLNASFLVNINRCTLGKDNAVSFVDCPQVNPVVADAQPHCHDSTQQFAVLARIERRQRQFVPTLLGLIVHRCLVAHLPDKVISGFVTEPCLQDVADAEAFVLSSEEEPRALQPAPELHKAFLGILDVHTFPPNFSLYDSVFTYLPLTSSKTMCPRFSHTRSVLSPSPLLP